MRGFHAIALLLLLSACGRESTDEGPGPVAPGPGLVGSYGLEAPLTAYLGMEYDSTYGEYELKVVALQGTLALASDSTYEHRLQLEAYVDGKLAGRSRWTDRGLWRLAGDTLHFDSGFIENQAFLGRGSGERLTLLQDVVGEGVVASFPFVRQPS